MKQSKNRRIRSFTGLVLVIAMCFSLGITSLASNETADVNDTKTLEETVEIEDKTDINDEESDIEFISDNDEYKIEIVDKNDEEDFEYDSDLYGLYGGYDGQDSMDDPEVAGACVGWDDEITIDEHEIQMMSNDIQTLSVTAPSGLWWIDDYYVNTSNLYEVYETSSFTLKYQFEFHASEDFEENTFSIVIDASLGKYRGGSNILFSDIGIPQGTPGNYTSSTASPFNWYYTDNNSKIIVWNYKDIPSGSNAMFQVIYNISDIINVYDETQWELEFKATATTNSLDEPGQETTESVEGNTLKGRVNTEAKLTSLTKTAYSDSSEVYTPGLYTVEQVNEYISGSLQDPYASNFDDYIFVVWKVTASGSATQAWSLDLDNESTYITVNGEERAEGEIIGYSGTTSKSSTTSHSISASFYVVTAYSRNDYNELTNIYGTSTVKLENNVSMTVTPMDGYDDKTTKTATVSTTYEEGWINLTSVTKSAYKTSSVSYTPELYTKKQVNKYISNTLGDPWLTDFNNGENKYIYIVWQVSFKGSSSQGFEIYVDESTFGQYTGDGWVVGYKTISTTSGLSSSISNSSYTDGEYKAPVLSYKCSTAKSFNCSFYVVTAYDKESYVTGSTLANDVTITAHPTTNTWINDAIESAHAEIHWGEYVWVYKGNTISVTKSGGSTYKSYLDIYRLDSAKDYDTGSFSFTTKSTDRHYKDTHYLSGNNMGEWIEGSYYTTTTVDDALYLYPDGYSTPAVMMTKDDYYFSSVSISTSEHDYDVWEDETASATKYDGIDQSVYIYAMFYKSDENVMDEDGWELVTTVPWSNSGSMSYTFTSSELSRQPYRVKVVHSTANYETNCTINVGVTLRANAPSVETLLQAYGKELKDMSSLVIKNLSGVAGQIYDATNDGTYFQSTASYTEEDTVTGETLEEFTENLYHVDKSDLLIRSKSSSTITPLEETAAMTKSVTTTNDKENARVLANYYITAYEGYSVSGSSTVGTLKSLDFSLPDRNDVVFYDLLPYGMKFNANSTVTVGRISSMNSTGTWKTNTGAWSNDVTVTVTDDDVIDNWNNTGRTMIIFHLHYNGNDASEYYSNGALWYEGFGVNFQAYYDWADQDVVDAEYNIAAYIVENVDNEEQQLLGSKETTIYKDDGSASLSSRYSPLLIPDLNNDGVTELYTNMYASASTSTNIALASADFIKKQVKADDDAVAEFGTTATVGYARGYTYEISLTNSSGSTLSDIVLFDKLEYSVEDGRVDVENEHNSKSVYKDLTDGEINNHWTGTYTGLTLTALTDAGIAPVIYYNEDRNATISSADGTTTPTNVLTKSNGWYEESVYLANHDNDLSDVKAIAIDISKKSNGGSFKLESMESLSYQIHMKAPDELLDEDCIYAFNNPSYYSVSTPLNGSASTSATDIGDTVRVKIGGAGTLEVEKEFAEGYEVPSAMTKTKFTYTITRLGEPLANQEYMLYSWDGNSEDWVFSGTIKASDVNGQFTLQAGQKAVFTKIVDLEDIVIEEVEEPMWKIEVENRTNNYEINYSNYTASYYFENKYRSPVYLYKTALTTDYADKEYLETAEFTFLIEIDVEGNGNYIPYTNGEILYVDKALTDGSTPNVLGSTCTDENGCITLKLGEIIAFFPEDKDGNTIGVNYRISEVETDDNWFCDNNTVSGTSAAYGKSNTIENYYKYRALFVTKDLENYDKDDCTDTFTFVITDSHGDALNGNLYYYVDENGDKIEDTEGYLEDGVFAITGYGDKNRIVIEGLVASEKYTVTETNYNEALYAPVNDGIGSKTMPTYSLTSKLTITNTYLLRDIQVSKLALSKKTDLTIEDDFEFTIYVNGDLYNGEYTVDDETYSTTDGKFTLKAGQTAYFDDIGYDGDIITVYETANEDYPQIYPTNNKAGEGTLSNNVGTIQFINGDFDDITIVQKTIVGLDDIGQAYVDLVNSDIYGETLKDETYEGTYAVEVTFAVYDENGNAVTSSQGAITSFTESNSSYPYVYIYVTSNGSITLQSYNGGEYTQTLYLGDTIYIAEIGNGFVKYEETGGIIDGLYDVTSKTKAAIGSEAIIVEGEVEGGTASSGDSVVLINNISSGHEESTIYKVMTDSSDEVTSELSLVLRVERYNVETGTWSPAEGIKYITFDGYTGDRDNIDYELTSGTMKTGSDGKITLTKGDNGYPFIRFTEDVVYANLYGTEEDAYKDGQLRIVELLSESDDEWGTLVGYDDVNWNDTPALNVTPADTIVNGNDTSYLFEVEKVVSASEDNNDDAIFTFTLLQIITTATDSVLEESTASITLTLTDKDGEPLSGGVFDLYMNNEVIQSGLTTNSKGQITVSGLTGGNYYFVQTSAPEGYTISDDGMTEAILVPSTLIYSTQYALEVINEPVLAVNYAVKIWGIMTDTYSYDDGSTTDYASLTFGPALGQSYLNTYISCDSDTCIHKLSWDEIIDLCEQNHDDQSALEDLFGSCLENGCTKAVPLEPNDTLFNMTTVNNMLEQGYTGDGVGTLYYLLNGCGASSYSSSYTYGADWNYTYSGYSSSDPANIYSRSRIRAMLIGDSTDAQAQVDAEKNDYYDVETMCDETNCLFSCFPSYLQNAIVPRTTLNSGNATSGSYKNKDTKTTYDKLYLFSLKEIGISNSYDDGGGDDYGVNPNTADRIAYEFSGTGASASSSRAWWSRSRYSTNNDYASVVYASGSNYYNNVYLAYGVSAGFSIY